jgi:hypothetical protein
MKPTLYILLGLLLFISACKNPKPDLSGLKDPADTTMTDTSNTMADAPAQPVDSAAAMQAWMDFATPGDMHRLMASWDGTWSGDMNSYMNPGAPPVTSPATVKSRMILDSLYQVTEYSATMMGRPFSGQGILAYDKAKKEFINTWIDNLGSGVVIMRGTYDASSKTLRLKGTQTDPVTGKDSGIREEIVFPDDNTQILTMWGEMNGQEVKFLDATFKRKM